VLLELPPEMRNVIEARQIGNAGNGKMQAGTIREVSLRKKQALLQQHRGEPNAVSRENLLNVTDRQTDKRAALLQAEVLVCTVLPDNPLYPQELRCPA